MKITPRGNAPTGNETSKMTSKLADLRTLPRHFAVPFGIVNVLVLSFHSAQAAQPITIQSHKLPPIFTEQQRPSSKLIERVKAPLPKFVKRPGLSEIARRNLRGTWITPGNRLGGHCAGFARESVWQAYYTRKMPPLGLSATQQFYWFKAQGYAIAERKTFKHGDLLYNFRGKYGHVMIVVSNNTVAENSTVHGDKYHEGRGTRKIANIGTIQGVIRLPSVYGYPR
jgi:hypothetical protein